MRQILQVFYAENMEEQKKQFLTDSFREVREEDFAFFGGAQASVKSWDMPASKDLWWRVQHS